MSSKRITVCTAVSEPIGITSSHYFLLSVDCAICVALKETGYVFFLFFPFPYTGCCACERSSKFKRSKSTTTEAPLSHRNHCSWNASSVAPPLISDIALRHKVTHHIIHGQSSTHKLIWHSCSVVVSGAGSGVCEPTNQSRVSLQDEALKTQEQ